MSPVRRDALTKTASRQDRFRAKARSIAETEQSWSSNELLIETSHANIALRQTEGSRIPLLFLHGQSSSKEIFSAQFGSSLGKNHRLIGIDLPGHGGSGDAFDPVDTYQIGGYADAAIEVLEALDIDEIVVVGWSLGGHVALEILSRFPGVVGCLITGTPPLGSQPDALQRAFRPSASAAPFDASGTVLVGLETERPIRSREADPRAKAISQESLIGGRCRGHRELVETSDVPIAVVCGADDPVVDIEYVQSLAYASLWTGACRLIPRAGHVPFLTAAPVFNHLLATFAGDMDARARDLRTSPLSVYSA